MKQFCTSETTGLTYCPEDTVQIINPKQIFFYMCKGLEIKDVFPSLYYKTGKKTLVFRVDKKESSEIYKEWVNTVKIDKNILDKDKNTELSRSEVRILNLDQVIFYLERKAKLKRFQPSLDYVSGEPVLVFIFDKKETLAIYNEWKNYKANLR